MILQEPVFFSGLFKKNSLGMSPLMWVILDPDILCNYKANMVWIPIL